MADLPRPLVHAAGHRVLGRQFRETKRHQQLAKKDHWPGPEKSGAANGKAQMKHLEHAGQDRQVRKPRGERGEVAQRARQFLFVAERGKIPAVGTV